MNELLGRLRDKMITLPSQYQYNFALKTDLIVCFAVFIFYFLFSIFYVVYH